MWESWVQTDKRIQSFFWKCRVAIDLHEESSFIANEIFTNQLERPCVFTLVCIATRFMGRSFIKIAYSVGFDRHFNRGVWLTLPCRKITTINRRIIRRPWATRSIPILGPSPRNLVGMYRIPRWWYDSMLVFALTWRVLYIASPSRMFRTTKSAQINPWEP